ncbi:hypothetical protein GBAR_LOCUS31548, partial [Geodia barretti]
TTIFVYVWCAPIGTFPKLRYVVLQLDPHGRPGPVQDCFVHQQRRKRRWNGKGRRTELSVRSKPSKLMSNSSSITPVSLQTNEPGETSVVQQDESTTGPSHVQTMYLPSETGETGRDWHRGSHVRYTELLRKHQRQPQGTASLTHCCNLSLHGEVERVWISCRVV